MGMAVHCPFNSYVSLTMSCFAPDSWHGVPAAYGWRSDRQDL